MYLAQRAAVRKLNVPDLDTSLRAPLDTLPWLCRRRPGDSIPTTQALSTPTTQPIHTQPHFPKHTHKTHNPTPALVLTQVRQHDHECIQSLLHVLHGDGQLLGSNKRNQTGLQQRNKHSASAAIGVCAPRKGFMIQSGQHITASTAACACILSIQAC